MNERGNTSVKNRRFLPSYIFGTAVILSASVPLESLDKIKGCNTLLDILLSDCVFHFFAFGIFALLLSYGFLKRKEPAFPVLKIGLLSSCFGVLIEIIQIVIPYRTFGLIDIVFDLAGIVTALVLYKFIVWNHQKILLNC